MVSHWISVNDSMLAWWPQIREPLPEFFVPPKGEFASSDRVCSLMWTFPESSRPAMVIAMPTSPRMPLCHSHLEMLLDESLDVLVAAAASSARAGGLGNLGHRGAAVRGRRRDG